MWSQEHYLNCSELGTVIFQTKYTLVVIQCFFLSSKVGPEHSSGLPLLANSLVKWCCSGCERQKFSTLYVTCVVEIIATFIMSKFKIVKQTISYYLYDVLVQR